MTDELKEIMEGACPDYLQRSVKITEDNYMFIKDADRMATFKMGFKAALSLEVLALVPEIKNLISVLDHAVKMGQYTPGGSTENWAKETLKPWTKHLGGQNEQKN